MKRATPASSGYAVAGALGGVGRAERFDCGSGRELWRLRAEDTVVATRLLELGRARIGGFFDGGVDDDGPWLVRSPAAPSLAESLDAAARRDFRKALEVAISFARALDACEARALFPGPVLPSSLRVSDDSSDVELGRHSPPLVELRADPLVRTLIGAPTGEGPRQAASASPRWSAPEQADGAPWDNRANRYVLGLVLYRMLSGEHPFAGKGLRLGLEDQRLRGAPPLADEVAAALPPGLQSFCLKLLDPDPGVRPGSAREIAERLERFLERPDPPRAKKPKALGEPRSRAVSAAPDPEAQPAERRSARRALSFAKLALPIAGGIALGAGILWLTPSAPKPHTAIADSRPLPATATEAQNCASCHPRHAAEWRRSVMAHSVKSPLFEALEMLIEEQVGRDRNCPEGAGILRSADERRACRSEASGVTVTGAGGELWCVNCHAPGENLSRSLVAWDAIGRASSSRHPLRDLLPEGAMEGVSCGFCHEVHGPVHAGDQARGRYEGNPFWTSVDTGRRFEMRPEDRNGLFGISNSGYSLDPLELFVDSHSVANTADVVAGGAHARPSDAARAYLRSSEFCGSCHDVRLFGTDALGVLERGEHFKRLRNAYSEWALWAEAEQRAGRPAASCQSCHLSTFPGVCAEGDVKEPNPALRFPALERACPPGTHFEAKQPGSLASGSVATTSKSGSVHPHYFTGVDVPLATEFKKELESEQTVDTAGIPLGARQRRDILLAKSVRLTLGKGELGSAGLELPIEVENVGSGHRIPAGFSQERELWIHLKVTDAGGALVYEVGRVDRHDDDLKDKIFLRINTDDRLLDGRGRPLGVFGADVADGPDVPRFRPSPSLGGTRFRGRGLVNFQNGFLRCVVCIGEVDGAGRCQPRPGQDRARADRFADGEYDADTGACRSNLSGREALFETYLPVGALDASRGVIKAPDAIIDTRSLPPGVPIDYTYEIPVRSVARPLTVEARLLFRAFPPYLVRAFIDYEKRQASAGRRPSGPLVTEAALDRLEIVELVRARAVVR